MQGNVSQIFHLCPSLNLGAMILKTYTGYVFSSPPFILFEKVYYI